MEKLIYPFWKKTGLSAPALRAHLLQRLVPQARALESLVSLEACLADEDVAVAAGNRIATICTPPFDGAVIAWLHSASERPALERLLCEFADRFHGYRVTESDQLRPGVSEVPAGQRVPGMNQLVLLGRPEALTRQQWLQRWQEEHTAVAIETQSTFGYRQNLVVTALTPEAPHVDAIVEENFPAAAMADRMAFFDAAGDEALYREREARLLQSVSRFVDFERIDCIPCSHYILLRRELAGAAPAASSDYRGGRR